jgi:hypothetical protein
MSEMRKYGVTLDSIRIQQYFLDVGVSEKYQTIFEKSTHRNDEQHYNFLEKMISTIAEEAKKEKSSASLVIINFSHFSTDEREVARFYASCWENDIDLRILDSPWLNCTFLKKQKVSKSAAIEMINVLFEYDRHKAEKFDYAKKLLHEIPVCITHDHNRGKKLETRKSLECKSIIIQKSIDFSGTMKDQEMIEYLDISRNSYYKYKRELRNQIVAAKCKDNEK